MTPSPRLGGEDAFTPVPDSGSGQKPFGAPGPSEPTAPRGLSLRRNFGWTISGNVFYAGCQWGMLMALAKLGSPEMVGQFALGLAIGAPVMLLANLQLRSVLATDVKCEYKFGEYLGLRLVSTLIAFAVISAIAVVGGYRPETAWVIVLVGLAKSVESVSDIVYGVFQKYERLDRIAIAMILRGAGSLTFFALAIYATGKIAWGAAALVAWWSAVLAAYEWNSGRALLKSAGSEGEKFAPSWGWPRLRQLTSLSIPLGLVMVLASLGMNLPRYFVEHYMGEAALGYFAAMAYVMVAGYTATGAMGQSATPRLARYHVSDPPAFRRLLAKMLLLAAAVGTAGVLVASLWGRPLLILLYRPDYAGHAGVFVWIMVASAISYLGSMLGYGMTASRIFRAQVPLLAASCLGITVTCALFIPDHGLLGAAAALVVGASITAIGATGIFLFRRRARLELSGSQGI